jgi:hypothetical protein
MIEFQSVKGNFSLQIEMFMINPSTFLHSIVHQKKMKTGKVRQLKVDYESCAHHI